MISTLLFDFNGTLIRSGPWMALETKRLPEAALNRLAEGGFIPPPQAETRQQAEAAFRAARAEANRTGRETSHIHDLRRILAATGSLASVPPEAIEATVAALHRECLETVELLAHAAGTLAVLKKGGYRLGIISNAAYPPFLRWTLERFGLADEFEMVLVSADAGWRKPWPEIFRLALGQMKIQAEQAVYIGDDYAKDVAAPKQLGLAALWYAPEAGPKVPPGGVEPDARLASLAGIPVWLSQQPGR